MVVSARRKPPVPAEIRPARLAFRDGRLAEAIALLDRALAREPDSAAAHCSRAMILLAQGRFQEGFQAFEWRHRVRGFEGDRPWFPRWDGRPAPGKTLVLWDEQGAGDTIHFARFAAVAARASRARVVVCLAPRLCRLLGSGARGWEVRDRNRGFPPAELQLSLMSVPAVLGLGPEDLAGDSPTLAPDPDLVAFWRDRLRGLGPRPRVGLTWRGNPRHPDDPQRSAPFSAVAAFVRRWSDRFTFVSLQKQCGPEGLNAPEPSIVDLASELDVGPDAFVDTAAVMSTLDLMLTTDTAAAHLAGALGLPVWLLLARPCDWRWGVDGDTTPFYRTARLFRQPSAGDWRGIFARIDAALAASPLGNQRAG
jgi:hypothetical protein